MTGSITPSAFPMHDYTRYFPQRCDDDRLDTSGVLFAGLNAAPDRPALGFDGRHWPVGELRARVAAMQHWLQGRGLKAGDRIAVMLGNSIDHIALIYALILSGIVWVPVNTRLKAAGLQYLLDHCRPALGVIGDEYLAAWGEAADGARQPCPAVQLPAAGSARASTTPSLRRAATGPEDILCLMYTSGTTGPPKGVQVTQRMLRVAAEAALQVAAARPGDRLFLWEPLCHIGGAQMLLAPFLADVQLHVVPAFSKTRFWSQVAQAGATHLHYLGGVLDILLHEAQSSPPPAHTLRVAWGAGLNVQAWQSARQRFGFEIRECYGMTEGASFATVNASGKPGSIGRPLPWITLQLLDDTGAEAACGKPGEIVLSSAVDGVFMPGYLDNPAASAQALRDGRLFTGDFARRDAEGDLFFLGRGTDSIRVRGENVSAWEIERVLAAHPRIDAVAAVGVDGEIGEQEILLYVRFSEPPPEPGAAFAELAQWAQQRLASFQVPRYYRSIERFELTASERIRKHLLPRDRAGAWDANHPTEAMS